MTAMANFCKYLSWFVFLAFAAAVGIVVAVAPFGASVRLSMFLVAVSVFVVVWMARAEKNSVDEKAIEKFLLLCVSFSVLWPRYVFFSVAGSPKVNPFTLLSVVALAVLLLCSLYSPAYGRKILSSLARGGWVVVFSMLWFAWRFFANFMGEEPLSSTLDYMREMVYLGVYVLIGGAIAVDRSGSERCIKVFVAAGMVAALLGLVEAFLQRNPFVRFASQDEGGRLGQVLATIALDKVRYGAYRAQSTFDHPIVFSQFMAALMPLSAYCVLCMKQRVWKLIGLLVIPISAVAILKSGSRGGLVSFLISGGVVGCVFWIRAIFSRGTGKLVALISVPLVACASIVGIVVAKELVAGRGSAEAGSTDVRMAMLRDGARALKDSPVWGYGQGLAIEKAGAVNGFGVATIDNYLLNVSIDGGYVGLVLFLLVFASFAVKGFLCSVSNKGNDGVLVGVCVASVLALIATFTVLSIPNNMTMVWVVMAIAFPFFGDSDPKVRLC